jgi:hypothetical protein
MTILGLAQSVRQPKTFHRGRRVRRIACIALSILCVVILSCESRKIKLQSFDEIRARVKGKTAAEVLDLLGKPDLREKMLLLSERWSWWDRAYLEGNNYPPEMRGRHVHVEIVFDRTGQIRGNAEPPLSELRAGDDLSVSYTLAK